MPHVPSSDGYLKLLQEDLKLRKPAIVPNERLPASRESTRDSFSETRYHRILNHTRRIGCSEGTLTFTG